MDDKKVEKELTKELDNIVTPNTMILMKEMAYSLSNKTKVVLAPPDTKVYHMVVPSSYNSYVRYGIKHIPIEIYLHKFFGMYVGYNEEYNILVYWKE